MKRKAYIFSVIAVFSLVGLFGNLSAQTVTSKTDTLLNTRSVEALVKLRKALAKERQRLLKNQERIRDRGVELSQEFLDKTGDENATQDKILIRVAEYYIEEEDLAYERRFEEEYETAFEEYEKKLAAYEAGQLSEKPMPPQEPQRDYSRAIEIYDLLIQNFPGSDLVDDAYYNKAFLLEKMKRPEEARQVFQALIDEYPESEYTPEAYMNLAESFFDPKPEDSRAETILKLNKAIQLYKNVLQYKDSPRYDEALYKLGWSYYRLAGDNPDYYTDAIVYFTAVVKDIERFKKLDPSGELVRTDVKPEALEFIAASFIDPGYKKSGVGQVQQFIEKLGMPEYGITVMENVGDRYAKIAQWDDARRAYQRLLEMYPDYRFAPQIYKKIADAYVADRQFTLAYEAREELFERYGPKSTWYIQLEQSDNPERIQAMEEAYTISEEALRTNITYLYNAAVAARSDSGGTAQSRRQFNNFVSLCQRYLENFPTDENAYEINWSMAYVLDTELGRFEEAFAEYIRVSNDYLETEHQLDAAINAITVADTLVKLSRALQDPDEMAADAELANRQIQDLSKEEKMLAEAYDNYIKLFPASERTPEILAAAGALYYNHRKYDLARKYYKTMVTKFPESQEKSIGLVSLMNSYFFLGQYRDAEIVAKKILQTPDAPEKQIEVAKSRIGESIFKNAERLEQEGDYLEAAKEYRRVYEEASEYVNFVDASLFRSARNFERANEWQRAIDTYNILISQYPDSKQVLPALNNIAADYKELEDYLNVAQTNERIFEKFPGTPEAENALFNASLFYARAEAWQDAIRTNNAYIKTYPDNPESKDLLFENAKYYLKLGDLSNANRIYKEFARIYPNDPLTIEAYYNRGNYYFERGQLDSAKIEFNAAIQRSDEFARTGRDPNLYYAAEANFKLGQILNQEYRAMKIGPPQSTLREQLERKRAKLNEVETAFAKVVQAGSIRSFEAMFRIAEAYEEFANAITNQELPPNLSREERLVQQSQVFSASVPAYEQAVEEYKEVLVNLPVLAEKLSISLDSTAATPEPVLPEVTTEDTSVVVQKEVEADSSREVALKWYRATRERISSIQYNVAERAADFITEYLRVENPHQGIRALVFQDQVLRQLVAPQVKITIEAHLKNIEVANELGLENRYVEESKRKVLLARNILANEYKELTFNALDLYRNATPTLQDLIERGETATTPDGMDYYGYQDDYIMQLIFYSKEFAGIALNQYQTTLEIAQTNNIVNDTRVTIEENMTNFGYEAGNKMLELARAARQQSEVYLTRFDSTQNENFQLGSTFFDDQYFELSGYAQNTLSQAYETSRQLSIDNIWTQLMLAKLVELDPGTYLQDLPRQEVAISSGAGWQATTQYQVGWNLIDFDDSGWGSSEEVSLPFTLEFPRLDSLQIAPAAMWVDRVVRATGPASMGNPLEMEDRSQEDSLSADTPLDSVAIAMRDSLAMEPDTVTAYFRKRTDFGSKPIGGWIAITGERSYQLFINEVYITGVDSTTFENVQLIPFSTYGEFLKDGENLIAISVTDMDGPPRYGVRFYLNAELLPGQITEVMENIRKKMGIQEVPREQLIESGILNKNRIIE